MKATGRLLRLVVVLLFFMCSSATAQHQFIGRWTSYSLTYRDRETLLDKKHDRIVLVFGKDRSYMKYFYTIKNLSDSSKLRLSYTLIDGEMKVTDAEGKTLKYKRVRERGTFEFDKDAKEVVFTSTDKKRYSGFYGVVNGILILEDETDMINSPNNKYLIKFKRG
jgi:hypothetical protein